MAPRPDDDLAWRVLVLMVLAANERQQELENYRARDPTLTDWCEANIDVLDVMIDYLRGFLPFYAERMEQVKRRGGDDHNDNGSASPS